ncbi:hypothetical protein KEJ27_02085 [Candidatus Bathyarchaeota archaeon]|nr:hypothetical protein [Candidatus Bathyarchaeota archaeon]MBS7613283.1 hypothetical protein [Candidatus Bathyarchaeota archaeon]MBS7618665.1 hypothetical protein [Candidatus Bathyarchaeota archaeon]
MTTADNSENYNLKTYSNEADIFLRVLTVNMVGGIFWALLQPLKDYDQSNLILIIVSGIIVGCIFSTTSLLIPKLWSKLEKRGEIYRTICDFIYSLISIYLTVAMIFLLMASIIALSGGSLTIRSNGSTITLLSIDDLLNSYDSAYILQLSIIPIVGSPVSAILRFTKDRMYEHLHKK